MQAVGFPKPQPPISGPLSSNVPAAADDQIDPAVAQAMGCLIAGVAGTGLSLASGLENVVNIVAGGTVVPVNQLALYTAVAGVVFGTFCAVGQAVTPLYLQLVRTAPAAPTITADAGRSCGPLQKGSEVFAADDRLPLLRVSHQEAVETRAAPKVEEEDWSTPAAFLRKAR